MSQFAGDSAIRVPTALRPRARAEPSFSERINDLRRTMWRFRWVYLMATPTLIWYAIFRYLPLYNAQIAFKDFQPLVGIEASPWVGLENLQVFLDSIYFSQLITNTVFFSGARLVLGMPIAILLALMLHETRFALFRNLVQTLTYLPHFVSWVIMFGILLMLLSPGDGLVNGVIKDMGGDPIAFMTSPEWFRQVVIGSDIWKETGWSTILYLASLLAISPELYEAAAVDGASRWQRIWHISLPGILPVIVLVTLLRLGHTQPWVAGAQLQIVSPHPKAADYSRFYNENLIQFALGQKPLNDQTWAEFLKGLDNLGAKEWEATAKKDLTEAGFVK